jgi:hypothetical protein
VQRNGASKRKEYALNCKNWPALSDLIASAYVGWQLKLRNGYGNIARELSMLPLHIREYNE